jgi:hypothetical protein
MSDCPSWPGGVAAAKLQTGWWIKIQIVKDGDSDSVMEPPPRRSAPPLLARRGNRSDLPTMLMARFRSRANSLRIAIDTNVRPCETLEIPAVLVLTPLRVTFSRFEISTVRQLNSVNVLNQKWGNCVYLQKSTFTELTCFSVVRDDAFALGICPDSGRKLPY